MKVTAKFLRSRATKPLHTCELLDLSNQCIDCLDKLQLCPKLRVINVRGNNIDYVPKLDGCPELWKIDLSNNKIKNVEGLHRFVALGTLILSNNCLTWQELLKLSHMHILDLSLHGNPELENDPYYRVHVIDILPNVWMLDGRIVTSAERLQVQQFFEDSALTEHPVRRKVSKEKFIPTNFKNIEVTGLFGARTDHLLRRFPVNGALNIETDRRRLKYLAYNIQEDLVFESHSVQRHNDAVRGCRDFLEKLLDERQTDRVRCNVMLLMLVASLEFAIPVQLMKDTLRRTSLDKVGTLSTMDLFLLPRETRCLVVSLLLSAIKIDKDTGEEGGLYDKLYLSLYYSVTELVKLSQGIQQQTPEYSFFRDSKSLIASELVQLLCVVPTFFDYISRDAGVMNLVALATSDPIIIDRLHKLNKKLEKDGCDQQQIYEGISQLIHKSIQKNTVNLLSRTPDKSVQSNYVLNTKHAIPRRPKSSFIHASEYMATGKKSPEKKTPRLKSGKHERRPYIPVANLGEKVLLGPQNIGRIISVPEPDLVLIQMDVVPAETGAMIQNSKHPEEHYTYVDMTQLYWDNVGNYWRPRGTIGDRITIQASQQPEEDIVNDAAVLAAKTSRNEAIGAPPCTPLTGTRGGQTTGRKQLVECVTLAPASQDVSPSLLPQPVSARYKQQLNLRLVLKPEAHGNPETRALDAPDNVHVQGKEEATDQSTATPVLDPLMLPPSDTMYRFLKDAVSQALTDDDSNQSAVRTDDDFSQSANDSRGDPSAEQTQSQRERESIITQWGGSVEDKDNHTEPTTQVAVSPSRRSSLESNYEPELQRFLAESSRPSTAHSRASTLTGVKGERPPTATKADIPGTASRDRPGTASRDRPASQSERPQTGQGTGTPALLVEIPQVPEEVLQADISGGGTLRGTEEEAIPGIMNKTDGLNDRKSSKSRSSSRAGNRIAPGPRPISAFEAYRMIVANDNRALGTQYQVGRMETWKNNENQAESPPPQPPSSPDPKERAATSHSDRHPMRVQLGEDWLAGGRDLHYEKQRARPKTAHVPGWLESMPQRPKSAAAHRAMKRTWAPNIITPSSIAYESVYAVDVESAGGFALSDLTSPRHGSPIMHNHDQLPGRKWESHPFARYVYVMRERNKLQDSVMCAECKISHRKQEEELHKILGGENSALINKLVAMEPCSHMASETTSEHLPNIR